MCARTCTYTSTWITRVQRIIYMHKCSIISQICQLVLVLASIYFQINFFACAMHGFKYRATFFLKTNKTFLETIVNHSFASFEMRFLLSIRLYLRFITSAWSYSIESSAFFKGKRNYSVGKLINIRL